MPEKRSIVINPQKILRGSAKEIPVSAIPTKKIQDLIRDMKVTLKETPNGVGLAAPQVGESMRLFIASEEAEEIDRAEKKKGRAFGGEKFSPMRARKKKRTKNASGSTMYL